MRELRLSDLLPGQCPAIVFVPISTGSAFPVFFAQSHTGDAQHGRLFLDSAGIGQHQTRAAEELEKIN